MKKIFTILLIFGCATITHNSFTILKVKKILNKTTINKPTSTEKSALTEILDSIENNRAYLQLKIDNLSQHHNHYTKPSDLLNDLFKNCNKHDTNCVFPGKSFDQSMQNLLNKEFEEKSTKYGSEYAWGYITCLIEDIVHNWCNWTWATERHNVYKEIEFTVNTQNWSIKDKNKMFKIIKKYKQNTSHE